ncbi:hypothetical protein [Limnothrix redekei]|uniref:Uncharacterized protein n=1 Tax=Limnothrix redekei LRLZ20PSL1 TaxID=3112953 RepID=A0ABW7CAP7_9CYAN
MADRWWPALHHACPEYPIHRSDPQRDPEQLTPMGVWLVPAPISVA